jgi:hypothetical protein
MEIIFLISWCVGIIYAITFTLIGWTQKDDNMLNDSVRVWVLMILTGWIS